MATSKELTEKLLRHYPFVYCPTLAGMTSNKNPKRGDIVLFYRNGTYAHTGIVYKVSGTTFYTIEGNTSGASGVIANGGGVCKKQYDTSSYPGTKFFRPDYSIVGDTDKVIDAIISVAEAEVGYLEKASNKDLYSMTGNAGSANYTKYWADLYLSFQGQPWCAIFVTWCLQKGIDMYMAETNKKKEKEPISPIIKAARYIDDIMQRDNEAGKQWTYSNFGCKITFRRARLMNYRKTNCAQAICWILIRCKVLRAGQKFFGCDGRIIWKNEATKKRIMERCEIIDIDSKMTIRQLRDKGMLKPCDVLCMGRGMTHTMMVMRNGYYFDAGHAYAIGSGEGAKFTKWIKKGTPHLDRTVGNIIRLKEK